MTRLVISPYDITRYFFYNRHKLQMHPAKIKAFDSRLQRFLHTDRVTARTKQMHQNVYSGASPSFMKGHTTFNFRKLQKETLTYTSPETTNTSTKILVNW